MDVNLDYTCMYPRTDNTACSEAVFHAAADTQARDHAVFVGGLTRLLCDRMGASARAWAPVLEAQALCGVTDTSMTVRIGAPVGVVFARECGLVRTYEADSVRVALTRELGVWRACACCPVRTDGAPTHDLDLTGELRRSRSYIKAVHGDAAAAERLLATCDAAARHTPADIRAYAAADASAPAYVQHSDACSIIKGWDPSVTSRLKRDTYPQTLS